MDERKAREERAASALATEEQEKDIQRDEPEEGDEEGEHIYAEHLRQLPQAARDLEDNMQIDNDVLEDDPEEGMLVVREGVEDSQNEEDGGGGEDEWVTHKLAQLPVVRHGFEVVMNCYHEVKHCHLLLDVSLDWAEFLAHLSMAVCEPFVPRWFRSFLNKTNHCCCACVDLLKRMCPELQLPAGEAKEYYRRKAKRVKVYIEPVTQPFRNLRNSCCIQTACFFIRPFFVFAKGVLWLAWTYVRMFLVLVVICYRGARQTVRISFQMVDKVAGHFMVTTEEEREKEAATDSNEVTIDMIQNALYQLLPVCRQHGQQKGNNGGPALTCQGQQLAQHIADTKWDIVKALKLNTLLALALMFRMFTAGVNLILKACRLTRDGAGALFRLTDFVWNRCIDALPYCPPKATLKDPLQKMWSFFECLVGTVSQLVIRGLQFVHLLPGQAQ